MMSAAAAARCRDPPCLPSAPLANGCARAAQLQLAHLAEALRPTTTLLAVPAVEHGLRAGRVAGSRSTFRRPPDARAWLRCARAKPAGALRNSDRTQIPAHRAGETAGAQQCHRPGAKGRCAMGQTTMFTRRLAPPPRAWARRLHGLRRPSLARAMRLISALSAAAGTWMEPRSLPLT